MTALIGRERSSALLQAAVTRTLTSHGGLVLVTGEAGIGKSVLVAETAAAAGPGPLVATGTCWDREGAPSYWPWVQVLRGLRRALDPPTWAEVRAAAGDELAPLLDEAGGIQRRYAGADVFGLHDAVTTLLVTAARHRPLVVVLDDLQWADPPSARLLEFVARHAWFEQLLVVGTYRDAEVESPGHPLGPILLPLLPKATVITLTGLAPGEVRTLLARTAGRDPAPETVAAVHRRTGGNPFFVEQTARLWQSTGSVDAVPPGVRDAVERRLALLDPALTGLLAAAAILGPEFDGDLLAAMTGRAVAEVDGLLADAVAARLVVRRPEHGRWAFVHDLVRETLAGNLPPADRRRWHAAAVGAFEAVPASAARAAPGEVAHHAYLGAPDVGPARAVALLRAAAQDAWGRMAPGEATVHLTRALSLVGKDAGREWTAVALDLGSARHHVGEEAAAQRLFHEVADVARAAGDPELLMRAALRLRRAVWADHPPEVVRLTTELVDEAYAALFGPAATATTPQAREQELTGRAVELARASGDDAALADALMARHDAIWTLGTAGERQAVAAELNAAGRRTGDESVVELASMLYAMAALEQGDPAALSPLSPGEPGGSSIGLWTSIASATLTGRFDQARALLAGDPEEPTGDLAALRFQQLWTLELAQGQFDAADALVRSAEGHGHPYPDLLLAMAAAERGDMAAAGRHVARTAPPSRWFEPMWLRLRAELAAAGDDHEAREKVRADLAPLAGSWLTMFGSSIDGPVAYWLAVLDAADHDWDGAVAGFTAAELAAARMGAVAWSLRARHGKSRALAARGRPGDDRHAAEIAAVVAREAAATRLTHLLDTSEVDAGQPPPANTFRFDGQVWTLTFDGITVHLPDAKGLHDLRVLLGRPGVDVPAADLLAPGAGAAAGAARRMGGDPVIDERAKASYRARLDQLDERIEAALARGDDRRAAEMDGERAVLIEEIRRATGLNGRSRRLGDEAERTRKAVTERIRTTLRRLDTRHPALAAHLRATVSTGFTCRYDPPEPTAWS